VRETQQLKGGGNMQKLKLEKAEMPGQR